jgi:hypothetical protein
MRLARALAAQNFQIGIAYGIDPTRSAPKHNGESAHGYQAIFVPSTALASPGHPGQPAVYFIHRRA